MLVVRLQLLLLLLLLLWLLLLLYKSRKLIVNSLISPFNLLQREILLLLIIR